MAIINFQDYLGKDKYCVLTTEDDNVMLLWKKDTVCQITPAYASGCNDFKLVLDVNNLRFFDDFKSAVNTLVGSLIFDDADQSVSKVTKNNLQDLINDDLHYIQGTYYAIVDDVFYMYLINNGVGLSIVSITKNSDINIICYADSYARHLQNIDLKSLELYRCCNSFYIWTKILDFLS